MFSALWSKGATQKRMVGNRDGRNGTKMRIESIQVEGKGLVATLGTKFG
jgi:hypothetical protein